MGFIENIRNYKKNKIIIIIIICILFWIIYKLFNKDILLEKLTINKYTYNTSGNLINSTGTKINLPNIKINNNGYLINRYGLLIDDYGNLIDLSGNKLNSNKYGYDSSGNLVTSTGIPILVSNVQIRNGYLVNDKNLIINLSGNLIDLSENIIYSDIYGYNSNGNIINSSGVIINIAGAKIKNNYLINRYGLLIDETNNLIDLSKNKLNTNNRFGYNFIGEVVNSYGSKIKNATIYNNKLLNEQSLLIDLSNNMIDLLGNIIDNNKYSYGYDLSQNNLNISGILMEWNNVGCYNDNNTHVIKNFRGNNLTLDQCKQIAILNNDTIIGLQNGNNINGTCYTGNQNNSNYAKLGIASSCNPYGGTLINNVYTYVPKLIKKESSDNGWKNTTWYNVGCFNDYRDGINRVITPPDNPVVNNFIDPSGINAYVNLDINNCKNLARTYGNSLIGIQNNNKCFINNKNINFSIYGANSTCSNQNVNNIYILE